MSKMKKIVNDINNRKLNDARDSIRQELQNRSYDAIQNMKPEVMKNAFDEKTEELDEATRNLTKVDKKTIDAFYNKKEDDKSFLVNSTGKVLKKVGFAGAQDIAKWEGGKVKIVGTLDDKSSQAIVNYIKKTFPKNMVVMEEEIQEAKMSNAEVLDAAKTLAKNAKDEKTKKFAQGLVDYYNENESFTPDQVSGLQNIMKNAGFQMAKES